MASGLWKAWFGISGLSVCMCSRVLVLLHGLLNMRQRNRHKACTSWVTAEGTEQRLCDYKMCAYMGECQYVSVYWCLMSKLCHPLMLSMFLGKRESKGSTHTQEPIGKKWKWTVSGAAEKRVCLNVLFWKKL